MKRFSDETFYTPEQVANKLQLSLTTVYNLIRAKEIPSIRIGKCFRISESNLMRIFGDQRPIIPPPALFLIDKLTKAPFRNKIIDVILFGSYARGTPTTKSDIDIILIHSNLSATDKTQLIKFEDEASEKEGYLDNLNVIKKSILKWKNLEKHNAGLYKTVSMEGISLWKR